MAYEIDALITFAEKDNETTKKGDPGWVTQFKKFLDLMLQQVLGSKPNIVLKSEFDSITASKLENVGVLITVLSRDFIQSGRCLDTVEAFVKTTTASGGNRLFKVLKAPLSQTEQPPRLREQTGYDMFQLDVETGSMKEYSDFFSQEAEKQYWMKLVDLAYDVSETLLFLREGTKAEVKNMYRRKAVFLAETGHDLSVQRNIIKRELLRHGYMVRPEHTLPQGLGDLERQVRADLAACTMSVHLIGSAYGEIPDGSDRSIVDIQNALAAEHSLAKRQGGERFLRLIWIAPNLKNASEQQKTFIETIRRDLEAQEGAEILQTPLEDFKNIMREELLEAEQNVAHEKSGRIVYLIHDRIDTEAVKPLKEAIEKSGFSVLVPIFQGDLMDARRRHIDNLLSFDAAIIFKNKVNDQWVRMKVLDLLKAPGFGRKKPIRGKAVVSTESLPDFEQLKNQKIEVITDREISHSIQSVKTFLQDI